MILWNSRIDFLLLILLGQLLRVDLIINKDNLSVHPSTKSFSNSNETLCLGRGREVI